MSDARTESTSFLQTLFELTKPYDKYISLVIILFWIWIRSQIKAKELEKQREQPQAPPLEEKSFLDKYFPKAKPFHPSDVLVKSEPKSEPEVAQAAEQTEEDSDISLVENPDTETEPKEAGAKKNE